jgi:hypothetical protein
MLQRQSSPDELSFRNRATDDSIYHCLGCISETRQPLKEHFGSIAKSSSSATIPFRRRLVGSPSAVPKRCGPAVSAAYEDVSLGHAEMTGVAIPREPLHDNAHPLDAKKVE